jgi:endoglucanase
MSSTPPEEDVFVKNVMPVSTTATADFAAVMARAARMYEKTDSAQAKKYLEASEKAWAFLENNPHLIMVEKKYEGAEFGGPYTDREDRDERLWAAAELFRKTKSEKYKVYLEKNLKSALENLKTGEWNNCHSLALFALYPATSGKNKVLIETWMKKYAQRLIKLQKENFYGVAVENNKLVWGSNSEILTSALNLLLISKALNQKEYRESAIKMLNYVLGQNPLNRSYVTGYGSSAPKQPHYRPSMSGKHPLPPGMLVGGPYSEEDYAGDTVIAGLSDKPPFLRYEDNKESWTTNEIAINWNAALLSVLSILSD